MYETIEVGPKDYNKQTKTFCFEASEKDADGSGSHITLKNPKTNQIMTFEKFKIDWNEGDVAGWWFKNGEYKLLIIND